MSKAVVTVTDERQEVVPAVAHGSVLISLTVMADIRVSMKIKTTSPWGITTTSIKCVGGKLQHISAIHEGY